MSTLQQLLRDERGSMLPVLAGVVLLTMAGAALAVDMTRGYSLRAQLQTTADAAALAAAMKLPAVEAAREAALAYAAKNMMDHGEIVRPEDVEFGAWDPKTRSLTLTEDAPSAVRVTARLADSNGNATTSLFAGMLGSDTIDIAASATAGKQGVACLIALDPGGAGLELNSNADLDLIACGAQSNSTKSKSLIVGSSSSLMAAGICVSGGADVDSDASVSPAPSEYCPPHPDPLANFAMPSAGGCTTSKAEYKDEVIALTPGVFCGGLKVVGASVITLEPGVYIIDDGKLEIQDEAVLTGDSVTILLLGNNAQLDIKNSAAIRLTAPTTGPYKGLLIVQDQGGSKINKWDSDMPSDLTGVVYLPDGKFISLIQSTITATDACFVLIASEIKLDGKARMSIDFSTSGCRERLPGAFSRSVALLE